MVKHWTGALAGTIALSVIAACSGGGSEKAGTSGKDEPNLSNEPVELVLYENSTGYTTEKFMELYGSLIQKKYPKMTFKMYSNGKGTTLPELLAQGVELDLVKVSSTNVYDLLIQNGIQSDISDLIKKYKY
ncbi:MAG: hypothetical protein K0Q59_2686, partial [Paenibacillus sp.]|nr:hypothetical protein [Paenibacillus sp.]